MSEGTETKRTEDLGAYSLGGGRRQTLRGGGATSGMLSSMQIMRWQTQGGTVGLRKGSWGGAESFQTHSWQRRGPAHAHQERPSELKRESTQNTQANGAFVGCCVCVGGGLLGSHPSGDAPPALDSGILKELNLHSQQLGKTKQEVLSLL